MTLKAMNAGQDFENKPMLLRSLSQIEKVLHLQLAKWFY